MILCAYNKTNKDINFINISGHANFDEPGSDIVCAAVSMLCFGIGNSLLKNFKEFELSILDNEFVFYDNIKNKDTQLLLDTLLDGLYMVEDQYSEFIKIEEV